MSKQYNFDLNRFSVTIEIMVEQSDLTVAQLAELAGIGVSTLYSIKNGTKCPSMAEFTHLCNLFDLDPTKYIREVRNNVQR